MIRKTLREDSTHAQEHVFDTFMSAATAEKTDNNNEKYPTKVRYMFGCYAIPDIIAHGRQKYEDMC
jgi:hypothetical protein